jgi:redox-sensitive bicupin YhaK (pirin superfamily)
MSKVRKIRKVFKSVPTIEGAGVHLKRAFGFSEVPLFDPFLLLDDFRSNMPEQYLQGFPWHPHRGIETITYMLNGKVEHADSMGNKGVIYLGGVQWMTAGSGIIHQEMPKGDASGIMGGFQLWANLPRTHKMTDPRYRGIDSPDIPVVELENRVNIKIICGKVGDTSGPAKDIVIDPEYLDISIPANTEYTHPTQMSYTVFAYVINGNGYFCQEKNPFTYEMQGTNYFDLQRDPLVGDGTLLFFEDGDELNISTEDDPIRFLLISGKPIHEPVAWYGPIVMNTRKELQIAIEEFQKGTFIKVSNL